MSATEMRLWRPSFPLLVLAALLGCGGGGVLSPQVCTACESRVTYAGSVQTAGVDLGALAVTVCRNDACATTRLAAAGAELWTAALIGPLRGDLRLEGAGDTRTLRLTLTAPAGVLGACDCYAIQAAPLPDPLPRACISYTSDCNPACKQATLTPFPERTCAR